LYLRVSRGRKRVVENRASSSTGKTMGEQSHDQKLIYDMPHRHYDVISAPPEGWESDPFKLTARNGYLYARGVADDKGPILAVACAAADLLRSRKLCVDLLFLVEGEEETGSGGFVDAVQKHKVGRGRNF
jgi:Peptidase family M20/M25/M40